MTRICDSILPPAREAREAREVRGHHDTLTGAFAGSGRHDDLLAAVHLCLRGERVFTSDLRREIAARGVDLESLALAVHPAPAGLQAP
jgi:hypothetical protein